MSEKKPLPLTTWPKPKTCPVCGHPSYSSTGIHPQCAMLQSERQPGVTKGSGQQKKGPVRESK
jgi:hypothetical protein